MASEKEFPESELWITSPASVTAEEECMPYMFSPTPTTPHRERKAAVKCGFSSVCSAAECSAELVVPVEEVEEVFPFLPPVRRRSINEGPKNERARICEGDTSSSSDAREAYTTLGADTQRSRMAFVLSVGCTARGLFASDAG